MASQDNRKGTIANGAVITAARKARGLSQEQLAAKVGCDVRTLRSAEKSGKVKISTLAEIGAALSLSVSQLLDVSERAALATTPAPLVLVLPDRTFIPTRSPPGALLRAEFRQVPFHGREAEFDDLERWCVGGESLRLRLYTGPGGMGKTRFLVEACHAYRTAGWLAGFVGTDVPDFAAAEGLPLLIVFDYAEGEQLLLRELIDRALRRARGKTRIVLLARAALDWWHRLPLERGAVGEFFQSPMVNKVRLGPVAMDEPTRAYSFRLALASFATALDRVEPREVPSVLAQDTFERVLFIHMLALSALEGIVAEGENGILDVMLARERRYWHEQAEAAELPKYLWPSLGQAMATITLSGGATLRDAPALLRQLPLLTDQSSARLAQLVRLLHDIYPGDGSIEPLMPDRLGEYLVQTELANEAEAIFEAVLGPRKNSPRSD